jgi:hypothetical protein
MTLLQITIAGVFGIFLYAANAEHAQAQVDLERAEKALALIRETADGICGTVRTEGTSDSEKVTGAVNAKLNGLIGKLADLGISGNGSYSADQYVGLIREDLPKALENVNACKTNVFDKLQPVMLPNRASNINPGEDSCHSIAGAWYNPEINIVIPIKQNGCNISSAYTMKDFQGSTIYHELTGRAVGDKFEFSDKVSYNTGCGLILYGSLTEMEDAQLILHVDHSSGQCGIPVAFTWTQNLQRR